MLILFVGLAFLIISFSSYGLAYQVNGINRVVINTPISIFEASLMHELVIDKPKVLFSRELIKEKLENYFSIELSKFTDQYTFDIYFYNKNDNSMCVNDECEAVEVSFEATLIFDYQYHRVQNYEVFSKKYES